MESDSTDMELDSGDMDLGSSLLLTMEALVI